MRKAKTRGYPSNRLGTALKFLFVADPSKKKKTVKYAMCDVTNLEFLKVLQAIVFHRFVYRTFKKNSEIPKRYRYKVHLQHVIPDLITIFSPVKKDRKKSQSINSQNAI